jgi:hypothetical protein
MAETEQSDPIDVRVTELPEAFTILLQSLADRLTAMETREAALQETISELQGRIDDLEEEGPGGMLLGAGGPVVNPMAADPETKSVDAGAFAQALGEQILAGSDENSDFTIDNVTVEAVGGLGQDGSRAQITTNAKQQAVSQNASKITFSVKRRTATQVVE